MSRVGILFRVVVGAVWLVAGVLKLPDPAENVRAVRAYRLLPESVVPVVGHGLPILEILLGACLLLGLVTRVAAVLSAGLLVAFVVGIASAWARVCRSSAGASAAAPVRRRTRPLRTPGTSRATSGCCWSRSGWYGGPARPGRWTTGWPPREAAPPRRTEEKVDEQEEVHRHPARRRPGGGRTSRGDPG